LRNIPPPTGSNPRWLQAQLPEFGKAGGDSEQAGWASKLPPAKL
jgi:hypothetical protein